MYHTFNNCMYCILTKTRNKFMSYRFDLFFSNYVFSNICPINKVKLPKKYTVNKYIQKYNLRGGFPA